MTEIEIWKDIAGYEGLYQVSNLDRVKSLARTVRQRNQYAWIERQVSEKIMDVQTNRLGYLKIHLYKDGKPKDFTVHQLVARAFLGEPPTPKHQVNHKNGNKADNNVTNLEWSTCSENQTHAYSIGLKNQKAEKNNGSKLTWELVNEIRELYAKGEVQKSISKRLGVSTSQVCLLVNNKTWRKDN